ncbi:hypothetical protein ACHAXR_012277 [Thalassiosira sp. AJA248-18]
MTSATPLAIQELFLYTGQERATIPKDVTRIRVHSSVKIIPPHAFLEQTKLEVVELCEGLEEIGEHAFHGCVSLRSIIIPSTVAWIFNYAFHNCTMLEYVELGEGLLEIGAGAFSFCALRQHIQNLALYQVIVEKYPENLITEDKWGALPILYAVWGNAPSEVIEFLIESHKARYPAHDLNWVKMMETLSMGSPPKTVKNLLDMQRNSFPNQSIDWDKVLPKVLGKMEEIGIVCVDAVDDPAETYRFLLHFSISGRLNSIGVKQWRDMIMDEINCCPIGSVYRNFICFSLLDYETKYGELKEATSMLELVLWKKKINESNRNRRRRTRGNRNKKIKVDDSGLRQQCRISCGAETVIENVLPFLLPART